MATWSEEKVLPAAVNGGNELTVNDQLPIEAFNAIVNNGFYSAKKADESTITYFAATLEAESWSDNAYTIPDIELEDGDKIIIYPADGATHADTIAMRNAWADAEISYAGDDSTDIITLTAETAPAIDIDVVIEVR